MTLLQLQYKNLLLEFYFLKEALDITNATYNSELRNHLKSIYNKLFPRGLKLEFQMRNHLTLYLFKVILGKFQIFEQVQYCVLAF